MEDILKYTIGPLFIIVVNYFVFQNTNIKRLAEMETTLKTQDSEIKSLQSRLDKTDTKIEQKIDQIRNELKNDIKQLSNDIKSYIELIVKK